MQRADDGLVTVATGYGLAETVVTASFLRAYGVPTLALPSHFASIFWHYTVALGGIEIRVAARQVEEAQMLLDSIEQSHDHGRTDSIHPFWRGIAALMVLFFFSVPPPAKGIFRNATHSTYGLRPNQNS
ncbi:MULTISPECIES: hypothetical protein [Agrobacterium]|uniref:hypothetical protein n=1 Tax=Agrobacterium TaxID=357 RepID=UPI00098F761D|nr:MULTISPECIES: hypothetical protein [Agrobacterium]MDA5637384.1 hypothetical protein [Agrobacterium sp. ST15.13.013]MDA6997303.1 hypothetical protein [Agrobacterium salinitolerans]OOO23783.1 hypothetical protein BS627_11495 [Agrobacterium salinitolerans]PNQ23562.1 hypothetical protein C2E26_11725 [Rhizobium sp. YIC5082]